MSVFKSRVATNAMWLISVKIIQSIISFIIGIFTARYLGPANYGTISYAASIVAFFVPVMNLGLTSTIVQELINAPEKEGEIMGTSMRLCSFSALFCMAGVISFALISNPNDLYTVSVCALYSVLLFFQGLEIIVYWFQAHLLSKHSSIVLFGAYIVVAIYKIYLLVTGKSLLWFAASNALDYGIVSIVLLIVYKIIGGQALRFNRDRAKMLLVKSKYYIIANLMVVIFAETDKIMLKEMLGSEYTGYYTAAATMASTTSFVFTAILDSFRPVIFEKKKSGNELFEQVVIDLYSVIIYLSIAQCVVVTILGGTIINTVYGEAYSPAENALRICIWYTMFSYVGSVRNIWLLAENKQKYLLWINLLGAGANVILNLCLIPSLGIYGAATASLLTQIFANIIVGHIIRPIRRNNYLMFKGVSPRRILIIAKNFRK